MSIKKIVITAMLSALIFVTTTFINIPVFPSTGGLIHFGNIFIFLIALTMDKEYSLSGAIGLTLFDLLNGYTIWAPVTFVSRFLMAYIVNKLAYKSNNSMRIITAMFI
ncbi:MAG: ECF transporter S component, partial [Candidatus Cloacimonetes bacterium]|nr:ECF transporter S component [Candidatus Cloacimonadota bacterium]